MSKNKTKPLNKKNFKKKWVSSIKPITEKGFTNLYTVCYITLYIISVNQMTPEAEKFNGWAAMLGFVAAFGAYATTGQIIPGIF